MSEKTVFENLLQDTTPLESLVIVHLFGELKIYLDGCDDYTSVTVKDLATLTNLSVAQVKGVVGSLVKKEILFTWDTETGYDVIGFENVGDICDWLGE